MRVQPGHERCSIFSAKAYWKVTRSSFRDDIVEREKKTTFPNFTLLNSMKESDLLTDRTCIEPSMLKALWDLGASSVEHPNHRQKSTQWQKSLTMELRKGSRRIQFAPLPLNSCQDPTGRTVENYIFLPIEKHLCPLPHHSVTFP